MVPPRAPPFHFRRFAGGAPARARSRRRSHARQQNTPSGGMCLAPRRRCLTPVGRRPCSPGAAAAWDGGGMRRTSGGMVVRMNRLRGDTSPHLLQHADNPVEWYPWGDEALDLARSEGRPILLSIGYSACHWCHVMAHESFEDPATAEVMNRLFVNVKVDREERPDLDAVYMNAVVGMTGHGGWPMTVFLTPAGEPFHGGTYYPPQPRHGMPAFRQVLLAVDKAWREQRSEVERVGANVGEALRRASEL